ncbi:MAG: glycosyltransferase [Deltaproteobacteria bacterium]|nr:glycosyltransferase [Deltaproteobacteria bacterium]
MFPANHPAPDADPVKPEPPLKIVLAGVGSHGDIQPLLGLGHALRGRGHEVTLAAGDNYAAVAAGAGLKFQSTGSSVQTMVEQGGEDLFKPAKFLAVLRELAPEQLDRTAAAAAGADVVIGSPACFVGPSVAAIVGARYCWATYAPGTFATATAPFLVFGFSARRRWVNRLSHKVSDVVLGRALMGILNPLLVARGQPAVHDLARHFSEKATALYAVDEAFGPAPADWTLASHQTGFWYYDDGAPFPAALEDFLNAGEPPVYVGFGSMPVRDPAARTRTIVEAAVKSGRRTLISAGWGKLGDGELPSSILRIGGVSHARLFPRCAAIVHHCGAGTTSAASRSGVPQVPVPHAYDQPQWAESLVQLGVAKTIVKHKFNADELAAAIKAVVVDDVVKAKAQALGEKLRVTNGTSRAAMIIEGLR